MSQVWSAAHEGGAEFGLGIDEPRARGGTVERQGSFDCGVYFDCVGLEFAHELFCYGEIGGKGHFCTCSL